MNNTKPILFSTPMVQAILRGQKVQTRRPVKLKMVPPGANFTAASIHKDGSGKGWVAWMNQNVSAEETARLYPGDEGFKCPFGEIGTVLWCRETWAKLKNGHDEIYLVYRADGISNKSDGGEWAWKPSLFMPKGACRLFLRITDISVERLNDISEEDAIAEGIENILPNMPEEDAVWRDYNPNRNFIRHYDDPRQSFKSLWESINGKGSWEVNPWCWKICFERIEKPENW